MGHSLLLGSWSTTWRALSFAEGYKLLAAEGTVQYRSGATFHFWGCWCNFQLPTWCAGFSAWPARLLQQDPQVVIPCVGIFSRWWIYKWSYFPAAKSTEARLLMHLVSTLTLSRLCRGVLQKLMTSSRRRKLGSLDLMIGGISTSRKRCQGKKTTFAKLRYFWSNSFSDCNNILFLVLRYRAHCLNDWSKVTSGSNV